MITLIVDQFLLESDQPLLKLLPLAGNFILRFG
jgi:hypothetical protein